MTAKDRACFRCDGRTFVYVDGACINTANMGGTKKPCPLCAGSGRIPLLENIISEKKQIKPGEVKDDAAEKAEKDQRDKKKKSK